MCQSAIIMSPGYSCMMCILPAYAVRVPGVLFIGGEFTATKVQR